MSLLISQKREAVIGLINLNRLTLLCNTQSPYIYMSAVPRSSKHHKSRRFEIKSAQPDHRSTLISITNVGHYLWDSVSIKKKKNTISFFHLPVRETSARRDRMACQEGSLHCVRGKHGSRYKTYFTSLKPVLTFQTLTLAMLDKWAKTHEMVFFFLDKNCSWTLLPGSI